LPEPGVSSLVADCIRRDQLAWNKFVERFSSVVLWAIRDRLRNSGCSYTQQDVEDIFQDVFCLLWEKGKLEQIKDREAISAWLAMVAASCANNFFRNKREALSADGVLPEEKVAGKHSLADDFEQKESQQKIEKILGSLSAREVIVLKLNYYYDKTHQEIGRILKIPTNTVSSIVNRAKQKLKDDPTIEE